jgi:Flp pilus assembly pilin Flp
MPTLRRTARRLEDRGASAVEYGLMVAAIAAVIVGVTFGLGTLVQARSRGRVRRWRWGRRRWVTRWRIAGRIPLLPRRPLTPAATHPLAADRVRL